jgi:hypothetical protein
VIQVETYDFTDDSGYVKKEAVITLEETEFVVTDYEGPTPVSIYERDIGDTKPHTKHK